MIYILHTRFYFIIQQVFARAKSCEWIRQVLKIDITDFL